MAEAAPAATPQTQPETQPALAVNNIEVVYDEVILVLRGVSLNVAKGGAGRPARRQRRRQVDDAEGHLRAC